MPRPSPFHARTLPLCRSLSWKDWGGFAAVCRYDRHSEDEYHALRHRVGMIDVSPLSSLEVTGPDAGRLLSRVFSRDADRMAPRRMAYGVLLDPRGKLLDDGTCARITDDHFRLSTNRRWAAWLQRNARGLRVHIEDSTERIAVLAVQGPRATAMLAPLVDFELERMPFFRIRAATLGGLDVWVSRSGYTGDLGYELWVDAARATDLWDRVVEAGADHGLAPFGLDTLDVVRIEAGFVLEGVDYHSARTALTEARKSTAREAGLGWAVDGEREVRCIGQDAFDAETTRPSRWSLVGVSLDTAELEGLYHEQRLPPALAPCAHRDPVPVYADDGTTHIGQVTSRTWSPVTKQYIGLATVRTPWTATGSTVRVEHTVEYERRTVRATVVERPFFGPERMRARAVSSGRTP